MVMIVPVLLAVKRLPNVTFRFTTQDTGKLSQTYLEMTFGWRTQFWFYDINQFTVILEGYG